MMGRMRKPVDRYSSQPIARLRKHGGAKRTSRTPGQSVVAHERDQHADGRVLIHRLPGKINLHPGIRLGDRAALQAGYRNPRFGFRCDGNPYRRRINPRFDMRS
jgi:hypothetical protein